MKDIVAVCNLNGCMYGCFHKLIFLSLYNADEMSMTVNIPVN